MLMMLTCTDRSLVMMTWPSQVFGTTTTASETKKGYKLPRACMTNSDLARLINSDEVQSVLRPPREAIQKHAPLKKNPLKNLGAMLKLNPYAKAARRMEILISTKRAKVRQGARLAWVGFTYTTDN